MSSSRRGLLASEDEDDDGHGDDHGSSINGTSSGGRRGPPSRPGADDQMWQLLSSTLHRSSSGLIRTSSHLSNTSTSSRRRRLSQQQSVGGDDNRGDLEEGAVVESVDGDPSDDERLLREDLNADDVRALLEKLQNTLPFAMLLILYLIFKFTAKILYLVLLQAILLSMDSKFRARLSHPGADPVPYFLAVAAICMGFVLASGMLMPYTLGLNVWQRFLALPLHSYEKEYVSEGLMSMIWLIAVIDGWVRLLSVALKATLLSIPLQWNSFQKKKVCAALEVAVLLYRSLLPCPSWLYYYHWSSINSLDVVFAYVYAMLKCIVIARRGQMLAKGIMVQCAGSLEVGRYATSEETASHGPCSICYEPLNRPILLDCSHTFCADCITEWLDRELTCPLCRTEFVSSNPIPIVYRDGRTSSFPQIW